MSYVLPQEAQTQKLKSLDGDLKKIAEELIAKKFKVKEEVVAKKATPSRPEQSYHGAVDYSIGTDMGFDERSYINVRPDSQHRRSNYNPGIIVEHERGRYNPTFITNNISLTGIRQLIQAADYENIRSRDRVLEIGHREVKHILQDPEIMMVMDRGNISAREAMSMYGCRIEVRQGSSPVIKLISV